MFFPKFQGFRHEQHFHGIMMLVWMIFLIIQPLLIKASLCGSFVLTVLILPLLFQKQIFE